MRGITATLVALLSAAMVLPAAAQKLTVDEVIAKHLASIGTAEARTAVTSRVAEGTLKYGVITGGAGTLEGTATLVSQGKNTREVFRLNNTDYRGEDMLTDGGKIQVGRGLVRGTSQNRSILGDFLYSETSLLRDGVFGGTLSTSWPLLFDDPKYRDAKLTYEGLKNIDGVELHALKYVPKKKSDAQIYLYFDQDFHHVLTVANMTISPQLLRGGSSGVDGNFMGRENDPQTGGPETAAARQQPVRYRIEERYSQFRQVDGLTLPAQCDIKFSADGYRSSLVTYSLQFNNIQNNVSLDSKNFQIK